MNTWIEAICPACGASNWLDNGVPTDMTAFDVEGFTCWQCQKSFRLSEDGSEECDEEFMDGDVVPHISRSQFERLPESTREVLMRLGQA